MDYESVFQCLVLLAVMMDDNLLKQSITLQNCDYILVSGSLLIGKKCQKANLQLHCSFWASCTAFFYQSMKKQGGKLNFVFCKKHTCVHIIHWSFQLKRTLLVLKHKLLSLILTQIMISRADCRLIDLFLHGSLHNTILWPQKVHICRFSDVVNLLGSSPSTGISLYGAKFNFQCERFHVGITFALHFCVPSQIYIYIYIYIFFFLMLMSMKKHVISLLFVYQFFIHNTNNTLLSWVARVVKYPIKYNSFDWGSW